VINIKSDSLLQQEVVSELRSDYRTEPDHVAVTLDGGIVVLTGTVSGYAGKLAAQEAAHRVEGVLDVVNDIRVNGDRDLCDQSIARAIRAALEHSPLVPDERIKSTVSDGWVTLEGHVERLRHCDQAQHAVSGVAGIKGVYNKITVDWPRARAMTCGPSSGTAQARHAAKVVGF